MDITQYSSLPQRLSKLYSDTKHSSEAVIETKKTEVHPELSSLHRKYRIQKDRLIAWGLDWRDSDASSQDDIDESVARAGLTETVTSVLGTIKEILDEADRMNTLSISGAGGLKERPYDPSNQPDSKVKFDQKRYEDLAKDLTTSIDILYDLSRSRRTLRKSSLGPTFTPSKPKLSSFTRVPNPSEVTLVNTVPPNLSFRTGLPPKLDLTALKLPQEDPPPYDSTERPTPCRLIGQLKQSYSSTNPWKTSGSKTIDTPVLVEYSNFDPTYSATGVAPPLDRLEKLLALLVTIRAENTTTATLTCLGYFEDPKHSRYGLVYELPTSVYSGPTDFGNNLRPTPLSIILKASSVSQRGQSILPPPLEERFRLALRITKVFSKFHENDFEHQDIRSSNILLFRKKLPQGRAAGVGSADYDIRQPQVCSFDLFSDYKIETKTEHTRIDIYRHPSDPRAHNRDMGAPAAHFEMYSLALILIEIGLWLPLSDLFKTKYSLDDFKLRLGDLWVRKLASKCGSAYMQAARDCFSVADRVITGKQSSRGIPQVYSHMLANLQRCCLIDSSEPEDHKPEVEQPTITTFQSLRPKRKQLLEQNLPASKDSFPSNIVKRLSQEKESQELHRISSTPQIPSAKDFSDSAPIARYNLQTSVSLHDLSTAPTLRDDDPASWELQRSEIRSPSRESLSDISSLYKESVTQAATIIQRAWRARSAKLSFKDYKRKVTIIQRHWRHRLALRSGTASIADSSQYQSEPVEPSPVPELEVEVVEQPDTAFEIREISEKPVLRVHPVKLPPSVVDEWHQSLLPRLERLVTRALKDPSETVSIDLMAVGATLALIRPTMFVTCSSTSRVKAVLARKFSFDHELFDLKVLKGRVRRSKLARKPQVGPPSRSMTHGQRNPANPFHYQRPLCGASIGAFVGDQHLPPVSFGGVVMVDDEPYGMTVHHILDPPSDDESEYGDESGAEEFTRSSAQSQRGRLLADTNFLSEIPASPTPYEIPDEEDSEGDYELSDFESSDDEDDDTPHQSKFEDDGDVLGIDIGDGDELYITQPAFDDVEDGFFPSEEDAPEEHLDSHELGYVYASSGIRRWNRDGVVHEIDWALMKLKDERLQPFNLVQGGRRYRSNPQPVSCPRLLDPVNRKHFGPEEDEYPYDIALNSEIAGRRVHCFGRTSGLKDGLISGTTGALKIHNRTTMSQSWAVHGGAFGEGGDSGAWVIDNSTGKVCGHVLAFNDSTRVAYICPMEVLLEDMKRTLGVEKIHLPGGEETSSAMSGVAGRSTFGISPNSVYRVPDLRSLHINDLERERDSCQAQLVTGLKHCLATLLYSLARKFRTSYSSSLATFAVGVVGISASKTVLISIKSLALLISTALATSLEVSEAPQSPRPYIIRHLAAANAVAIGSQIYRFAVTGNSSGGAFSLVATNAPGSAALGVLPHLHQIHHENFFNVKGRFQLWAQQDGEQQSRIFNSGDYGAVPPGTNHTFQILDPDTEMTGVIVPGGFEKLFLTLGTPWISSTPTAYTPALDNTGSDPTVIEALKAFDVHAHLSFSPRRDLVDSAAPVGSTWHNGFNPLANDTTTPYFVARDHGPKHLSKRGAYQVVQPLVTPEAAGALHPFSIATISISRPFVNGELARAWSWTLDGAVAMEVLEGAVTVRIGEYAPSTLYTGDVAFVPGGTRFGYWSEAAFSKFLFIGAGNHSLDRQLMASGESWGFPVFPVDGS